MIYLITLLLGLSFLLVILLVNTHSLASGPRLHWVQSTLESRLNPRHPIKSIYISH